MRNNTRYAGLIKKPVGNNLNNDPKDVEVLKRNFAAEGSYNRPVDNGYIDRDLNDAIFQYQKDNKLKVDGRVNPGGETEATLVGSLFGFKAPPENTDKNNPVKRQAALPAALPPLAYRLAVHLGMSAMAAWTWWQNQTQEKRSKTLQSMSESTDNGDDDNDKQHCEDIYKDNTGQCNKVTRERGTRAGAICHESASQIYAACRAGKPSSQWPPLQD